MIASAGGSCHSVEMLEKSGYRADIDGLRALAVLAVIIYHLEPGLLPGGFVGVDVFFVISGYLITSVVRREVTSTGTFDFAKFASNRVRRLAPALFAASAATMAAAVLLFENWQIRSVAVETVAASTFVSNVLFWMQAGYFDADSLSKPLLHTWSLGVEAQFYLFWPFVILLAFRTKLGIAKTMLIAAGISLLAALIIRDEAAFFLVPFRIYEFALGGALTLLPDSFNKFIRHQAISWAGITLIAMSCLVFSKYTPWPTGNALAPAGAAALIIAGGTSTQNALLRSSIAAQVGRASYSLYLAHWPIIVFGREVFGSGLHVSASLFLLSIGAGYALHLGIEKKFYSRGGKRGAGTSPKFIIGSAGVLATLSLGSLSAYALYPEPEFNGRTVQSIIADSRKTTWLNLRNLNKEFEESSTTNILVAGDSQAGDFVNLLLAIRPDLAGQLRSFVSSKGCQIKSQTDYYNLPSLHAHPDYKPIVDCLNDIAGFSRDERVEAADIVVLAYAWTPYSADFLEAEIEAIRERNPQAEVYIAGKKDLRASSVDYFERTQSISESNQLAKKELPQEVTDFNNTARFRFGKNYIDVMSILCRDQCELFTPNGAPLLYDSRHFTKEGVDWLATLPETRRLFSAIYCSERC